MFKRVMTVLGATLSMVSGLAIFASQANALGWTESPDAGDLPGTAQVTSGPAGQPLTTINGTITGTTDRDMYRIMISNPTAFSASTSGGDADPFDAMMALFDASGMGIYFNDDGSSGVGDPFLPANHPLGPKSAGIYYIAVFSDETGPASGAAVSLADLIFPIPQPPFTAVLGPTGGGGGSPISGWLTGSVFALSNGYQINLTGAEFAEATATAGPIVSSVLPSSRSVQVGDSATAFATIINAGTAAATDCLIEPLTTLPANFTYQTTDASNVPIGTPDTPANITAGGNQSYVFAYTPTAPISEIEAQLTYRCTNTDLAGNTVGLNTLLLVADSGPVPDIVALGATVSGNGIVSLPSPGFFTVATVNVGVAGTITASADTGSASLPLTITLCETNPADSVCINPTTPTTAPVTTTIGANETPTFAFFVSGTGTVPYDPAVNRIFVRFKDGSGTTRGATSAAVRTQ